MKNLYDKDIIKDLREEIFLLRCMVGALTVTIATLVVVVVYLRK